MLDNKPKPHYQCFRCLRRLGFGYDRTAKHFRITKKKVHKWFKYHKLEIERPSLPKITRPPRPKIDWQLRYKKSHIKRKITCYLRSKIWQCFKLNLHTPSAQKLLGCTRDEFIQHIQSLLREGMTMQNYGKVWHLDHIRPCATFDLQQPQERFACFHYSNYQPLFAKENWKKARK